LSVDAPVARLNVILCPSGVHVGWRSAEYIVSVRRVIPVPSALPTQISRLHWMKK